MEGITSIAPPPSVVQTPAERVRALVTELAGMDGAGCSDADRLAAIGALEELKAASGAAQARVTVAFDASHRAGHADDPEPVQVGPDEVGPELEQSPSRRREGRGVAEMVALARRESPTRGDQHLGLAKALVNEMPLLHGLLTQGLVSEWVATKVVQGTAALTREDRGMADTRLAPVLPKLGPKSAGAAARRVAAQLDAASVVKRMAAAARSRRVTIRPAPDGMAYLSILAPLAETVGAFAALGRDADAVVGGHGCQPVAGRTRGQVMADLAIQRMGGLRFGQVQPVEIQLVMTDTALFGQDAEGEGHDGGAGGGRAFFRAQPGPVDTPREDTGSRADNAGSPCRRGSVQAPVEVVGFGPVPAAFIRDRLRHGTSTGSDPDHGHGRDQRPELRCENGHPVDPDPPATTTNPDPPTPADPDTAQAELAAQVWLRRLYLSPDGRDLVAMDSRRRTFGGLLRQFLVLRDQTCRVPWCEAPIRAVDHATPHARGGPTHAEQADGTCVRHNNVKEEPGWNYQVTRTGLHHPDHADLDDPKGPGPHTMTVTTPAGTAYESTAPPLLGWGTQPVEDDRPTRPLMATENRPLNHLQTRLDRGEDFHDADWTQYGHLTHLAAG